MSIKIKRFSQAGLWILALALSVIGILKTVYISADIDESYTVTMACRLVKGDRLFLDMWEIHQTSAVLYAPFVWIFQKVHGSVIGLLVFLRIVGVCIQGALSVFVYKTCKHYMGKNSAFLTAILFFNFTPKHIQSPEYALICCWGFVLTVMSLLQFYIKNKNKYNFLYLVLGAAGLCVTVLSYPAAVVLLIPFLLVIGYMTKEISFLDEAGAISAENPKGFCKRKILKNMLIFTMTCMAGGLLFLGYVLSGISFLELIQTVPYVFMDESHEQVMSEHILSHIKYLWDMLKITLSAVVLCHICRIAWRRWKKKDGFLFPCLLLVGQTLYAFVQFHTIEDVNFLIFFPVILQTLVIGIYFYMTYEKSEKDKMIFAAMLLPNVVLVAAVLLSSNLTANYSMCFLFPSALMGIYMIGRVFPFKQKAVEKIAMGLFCTAFILMVFTSRIFLVRYTATQRINVFAPNYEAWHGVLSGIRLGDTDYRQYEWKTASLHEHVSEDDVFLYVGADMFLYGETLGDIGTGNTISTPAFGEQLLAYYEMFPERIPTVIFLDCEYVMDFRVWLEKEPFGSFIKENYEEPVVEGPLYVYKHK